jgi:outer membrane protein assembly factor BamB
VLTLVLLLLVPGTLTANPNAVAMRGNGGSLGTSLPSCGGTDWPTYLGNAARTGSNAGETALSPSSAVHLRMLWNYSTGSAVSASAAIVAGVVYIGSNDGYEYALNSSTGALLWKTFLGLDLHHNRTYGIASSATIQNGILYVAGGNSSSYAVRASDGAILWNVTTGNTSQGYYGWASPLIVNGYDYIGLASKGDNPLVYAGLLQVSLRTHTIVRFFNTTANGTVGASIWTTPAYDWGTRTVFVTTGNGGPNGSIYADGILSFNASTLRLLGSWEIPMNQQVTDGDFGATPVLFSTWNGTKMVAASDKNGVLYDWNQAHLARGPVWQDPIAYPSVGTGSGAPNLGPVSWSGGRLFVGTSRTSIAGVNFSGSVRSVVPLTGAVVWARGEPAGPVYGAPVEANGIVAVGAGSTFQVLNASSGKLLFHFSPATGKFQGPGAIAHGEIVIGASDGHVYAFGLPTCVPRVALGAPSGGTDRAPWSPTTAAARPP